MWSLDEKQNNLGDLLFKLQEYTHLFFKRHAIAYRITLPDNSYSYQISPENRREVFLLLKECLGNIKKYAYANQVDIKIQIVNNHLELIVKDDGVGFVLAKKKGKGKGLISMENRAKKLLGNLKILTQPQKGTSITLTFPLN